MLPWTVESAVDDSCESIVQERSQRFKAVVHNGPVGYLFRDHQNDIGSGHQSSGSNISSAVDDSSNTECDLDSSFSSDSARPKISNLGQVHASLLKKLALATTDEVGHYEQELEVRTNSSARVNSKQARNLKLEEDISHWKQASSDRFRLPTVPHLHGIRIKGRDGQDLLIESQGACFPVWRKERGEMGDREKSSSSHPTTKPPRRPKAAGIVNLPIVSIPLVASSADLESSPTKAKTKPRGGKNRMNVRARDKQSKTHHGQSQHTNDKKQQAAEAAAVALMSGALSTRKKNRNQVEAATKSVTGEPVQSVGSSVKDSSAVLGGMFDTASKVSFASSRTSTTGQTLREAVAHTNENSIHERFILQEAPHKRASISPTSVRNESPGGSGGYVEFQSESSSARSSESVFTKSLQEAVSRVNKNSERSSPLRSNTAFEATANRTSEASKDFAAADGQTFQLLGRGWKQNTVLQNDPKQSSTSSQQKRTSRFVRSKATSKLSSVNASRQGSQEMPETRQSTQQSIKPRTRCSSTVFAGKGWISPHPLSRSPTENASPPQAMIRIPDDEFHLGGTMTYDEWKLAREEQSEHSNLSRTGSHVSKPGTPAAISFRTDRKATTRDNMVFKRQLRPTEYQNAYVESDHESQQSSSHSYRRQYRSEEGASKQSSQRSTWDWGEAANGWDAPPHLDGAASSCHPYIEDDVEDYKRKLTDIVSEYGAQREMAKPATPVQTTAFAQNSQLPMPWDLGNTSQSSRVSRDRSSSRVSGRFRNW